MQQAGFPWITVLNAFGRQKSTSRKILQEHSYLLENVDLEHMINAFPRFPLKIICVLLMHLQASWVVSSAMTPPENFPQYVSICA